MRVPGTGPTKHRNTPKYTKYIIVSAPGSAPNKNFRVP